MSENRPQTLELTAADELVALENIDVMRQNGFELDVSEQRPPGQRVLTTGVWQIKASTSTLPKPSLSELTTSSRA